MNPALTVTIIVAVIAVIGSVIVALIRKPVSVQDLWSENRSLRADLTAQERRLDDIETKYEERDKERQRTIGIVATALDVVWNHLQLMQLQWGKGPMPELDPAEMAIITQARDIRPPILRVGDKQ